MPYASDKQRRFMWSQHPEIAKKWAEEGHGYVKGKKKKHHGLASHLRGKK